MRASCSNGAWKNSSTTLMIQLFRRIGYSCSCIFRFHCVGNVTNCLKPHEMFPRTEIVSKMRKIWCIEWLSHLIFAYLSIFRHWKTRLSAYLHRKRLFFPSFSNSPQVQVGRFWEIMQHREGSWAGSSKLAVPALNDRNQAIISATMWKRCRY